MVEPLKDLTFECKACALFFIWINYFFESVHVAFDVPISYEVDSTKAPLAKQILYNVALSYSAP
jgi:hypothetical protein